MHTISDIKGRVIRDSRGTETLEVSVFAGDKVGTFSVPAGASTGISEVALLEPHKAVDILSEISSKLNGHAVTQQAALDALLHELDGTNRFTRIGGNTALGVSIATVKLAALCEGVPVWKYLRQLANLPPQSKGVRLVVNLINGGKHATQGSPLQEHQIIPDTDDVVAAYAAVRAVQDTLETLLYERYDQQLIGKGDEGGFTIPSRTLEESFLLLEEAITRADVDVPITIGCDAAASSFYKDGAYTLFGVSHTPQELSSVYASLMKEVPRLRMIEDPFEETDFNAFARFQSENPECIIVGDDVTTTNSALLSTALEHNALSGIIIKPNQIGTLSDTLATMQLAYEHNVRCIVSHRSGETHDDFIADLAFGLGAYGLKAGAPKAPERDAKYNRLLTIVESEA